MVKAKKNSASSNKKLGVEDWLAAAFRALTRGGPGAIKAEAIARDLKVSKGSFYWHFADVPALKSQMLGHWEERATQAIIVGVEETGDTPQAKLTALMSVSTSQLSDPYGGYLVEPAIRDWARYDKEATKTVKRVDTARIEYVERLFRSCKLTATQSVRAAGLLYTSLVGAQIPSQNKQIDPVRQIHDMLDLLLS